MLKVKAWAIYTVNPKKTDMGYMVDLNYKHIKSNWDGWFKKDGRWGFSEIEIRHIRPLQKKVRKK